MINLNFGDNEEASALKNSVSKWAPKHGFFIADMLDDIGGEPCGNGEGKIDEKNGSLS